MSRSPAAAGRSPFDPAELLERLGSRFVFVVGKGGVGKSTTSAALGLAFADAGLETHLISVDPAHSLGDLLEHPLPRGDVVRSPCTPRLVVEEIDAASRAREWIRTVSARVAELVELGSHLDARHVPALLEPALPGLGEVVSVLRLTEIEAGGADRVVVDTPPTAHALRLLDCGAVLDGWAKALHAMAEKAGAVQERLLRRRIRLEGETLVDELRTTTARFRERVVSPAAFVVLEGLDPIERAEADRLEGWIREKGGRVAARIAPRRAGAGSRDGDGGPRGCAGLRRWWSGESPARAGGRDTGLRQGAERQTPERGRRSGALPNALLGKDLLFFVGKGGVGKSTAAAACAVALARERPVLLVGNDPGGSLDGILAAWGGGRREREHAGEDLPPGLEIRQTDPEGEVHALRARHRDGIEEAFRQLGLDRSAVLDREVMASLLEFTPPGIDELLAMRALVESLPDPGADGETRVVVVDGTPTGHFLRLVDMTEPTLAWTHTVLRLILEHRAAGRLDGLARDLLRFAGGLRRLTGALRDHERTGVVVVTIDEPVIRAESQRLALGLRDRGVPIASLLLNRHRESADRAPNAHRFDLGRGAGSSVPVIVAPDLEESPVGVRRLQDFASRWTMAP